MKLNKIKELRKGLSQTSYKCKKNCIECCTAIKFLPLELKLMNKELKKNWFEKPPNWKGDDYCEYLIKDLDL